MTAQILTNSFLGPAYSLRPDSNSRHNGLHAGPARDGGLLFTFVPSIEDNSKFNICTTLPNGQAKCLDIYNNSTPDRTQVCLADPGYYAGQNWSLVPQPDGTHYKLSNDWTGPGWFLDTYSDGGYAAFMSQGEYSGQLWVVNGVGAALVGNQAPAMLSYVPQDAAAAAAAGAVGYHEDAGSSSSSDEGGKKKKSKRKIIGGAAAGYVSGKVMKNFT